MRPDACHKSWRNYTAKAKGTKERMHPRTCAPTSAGQKQAKTLITAKANEIIPSYATQRFAGKNKRMTTHTLIQISQPLLHGKNRGICAPASAEHCSHCSTAKAKEAKE